MQIRRPRGLALLFPESRHAPDCWDFRGLLRRPSCRQSGLDTLTYQPPLLLGQCGIKVQHERVGIPAKLGDDAYSMRNQRAVAKIIGARTFTISGLRRDAEWAYSEIRRIMRDEK
jgi:hypothetical protein